MESASKDVTATAFSGKKCIVTGGTSGIGKETALGLARLQGDVTIVGRSGEKCEAVRSEIISATSNRDISYEIADLSSMDAVRVLAEKIASGTSRIDVLVNYPSLTEGACCWSPSCPQAWIHWNATTGWLTTA